MASSRTGLTRAVVAEYVSNCPCDPCSRRRLCATDGHECHDFRQWTKTGRNGPNSSDSDNPGVRCGGSSFRTHEEGE